MIDIKEFSDGQREAIKELLQHSCQHPYRFLARELSESTLDSFWFNDLMDLANQKGNKVFIAWESNQIVGLIVYADLPWDTNIIGNRMGAVRNLIVDHNHSNSQKIADKLLDYICEWTHAQGGEFLLCKTYTDDIFTIHTLESRGFYLVDTLLYWVYDNRKYPLSTISQPILKESSCIKFAEKTDLDELMDVANVSFENHFGRYHSDPFIPTVKARQIYMEWIKSSCEGYADFVIVAKIKDRIAGYSVWKNPSVAEHRFGISLGHYSIAGVHPQYQGLGLFSALTYKGMEILNNKVERIEGPTHINNYPVQSGYTKLKWQIRDAHHSFHKWLEK